MDFPGLGTLEAIPNGDAVFFTNALGVTATIRETGRYSLRWPGWSAFWHPLKQLGFLSEAPVAGLPCTVSPYQMIAKGEIIEKGVLSPMKHIPYLAFIDALRNRRIIVEEEEIALP